MLTIEQAKYLTDSLTQFEQEIFKCNSELYQNSISEHIHEFVRLQEMIKVHQQLTKMQKNEDFDGEFSVYCAKRSLEINNSFLDFNASRTHTNQLIKSLIQFFYNPKTVKSLLSITHPDVTEQIELVSLADLNETQQRTFIQEKDRNDKKTLKNRLFAITKPLSDDESTVDFLDNMLVIGNQCFDARQLLNSLDRTHDIEKYRALATYAEPFLTVYEAYASLQALKNQILLYYGSGQTIREALFLLQDGFKKGGVNGRGSEDEADLIAVRAYAFWECFKTALEHNDSSLYQEMMQLKNNEGKTLENQLELLLAKRSENISCVDLSSNFLGALLENKNNGETLDKKLVYKEQLDSYKTQTALDFSLVIKIPSSYFACLIEKNTSIDFLMRALSLVLLDTEYNLIWNRYQNQKKNFGQLGALVFTFDSQVALLLHKKKILALLIDCLIKILPLNNTQLLGHLIRTLPNVDYIKQIAHYYFDKTHDELEEFNQPRRQVVITLLEEDEHKLLLFFELVKNINLETTQSLISMVIAHASFGKTTLYHEQQLTALLKHLAFLDSSYSFLNQENFFNSVQCAAELNTPNLAVIFYDFFKTYGLLEPDTLKSVEKTNDYSGDVAIEFKNELLIAFMLRECADNEVPTLLEWGDNPIGSVLRFRLIFSLLSASSFYSDEREALIYDGLFFMISNWDNEERFCSIMVFASENFIFRVFASDKTSTESILLLMNLGIKLLVDMDKEGTEEFVNPVKILLKYKELSQKVLDRLLDKVKKEELEQSFDKSIFLAFLIVHHRVFNDWRYQPAIAYIENKLKFIAEYDKEYGGVAGATLNSSLMSLIIDKKLEIQFDADSSDEELNEEDIAKIVDNQIIVLYRFLMNKALTDDAQVLLLEFGDYSDLIITLAYRFKTVRVVVDSDSFWVFLARRTEMSYPVQKGELIRASDDTIKQFLSLYDVASEKQKKHIVEAVILLAKMPHRVESFLEKNLEIPYEIKVLLCSEIINECKTSPINKQKVKQSPLLCNLLLEYKPDEFKSLFNEAAQEKTYATIEVIDSSNSSVIIKSTHLSEESEYSFLTSNNLNPDTIAEAIATQYIPIQKDPESEEQNQLDIAGAQLTAQQLLELLKTKRDCLAQELKKNPSQRFYDVQDRKKRTQCLGALTSYIHAVEEELNNSSNNELVLAQLHHSVKETVQLIDGKTDPATYSALAYNMIDSGTPTLYAIGEWMVILSIFPALFVVGLLPLIIGVILCETYAAGEISSSMLSLSQSELSIF
jgi:hypothetical protein